MTLMHKLIAYLWPMPPETISDESKAAFEADVKAKGAFGILDDKNRMRVDVWTRHRDKLARAVNQDYLRPRAKQFAARWASISAGAWALAMQATGCLWIEAPMTLIGIATAYVAVIFWWAHKGLNRVKA